METTNECVILYWIYVINLNYRTKIKGYVIISLSILNLIRLNLPTQDRTKRWLTPQHHLQTTGKRLKSTLPKCLNRTRNSTSAVMTKSAMFHSDFTLMKIWKPQTEQSFQRTDFLKSSPVMKKVRRLSQPTFRLAVTMLRKSALTIWLLKTVDRIGFMMNTRMLTIKLEKHLIQEEMKK